MDHIINPDKLDIAIERAELRYKSLQLVKDLYEDYDNAIFSFNNFNLTNIPYTGSDYMQDNGIPNFIIDLASEIYDDVSGSKININVDYHYDKQFDQYLKFIDKTNSNLYDDIEMAIQEEFTKFIKKSLNKINTKTYGDYISIDYDSYNSIIVIDYEF